MESKEIKVRFLNGRFVPLDSVSFKEGEIIEIEIISRGTEQNELRKEFAVWDKLSDESLENFEKEL